MSRIDEALRRASGGKDEPGLIPGQDAFRSAWTVSGASEPARPELTRTEPVSESADGLNRVVPVDNRVGLSISSRWRERLAFGREADPGLVEQFRRLAATLHNAQRTNGLQSVMVTSSSPGDGKTMTAVNLALTLAESYRHNVLLVDADLRRPSIPSVIELGEGIGLGDALRADTEQKLALIPVTSRLTVLPAGRPIENSIEALTSPRMRHILEEARARYDWIILDAPPVGSAADPRLLAEMVGGTLFVIHAGKSQLPEVQKSIDALGKDHILGVVLNGVSATPTEDYYYSPAEAAGQD